MAPRLGEGYDSVFPSSLLAKAGTLPRIKRFFYDAKFLDLIEATAAIETEEIIGQLKHASFPYDHLWIEGPSALPNDWPEVRTGMWVTADQEKLEFSFRYVRELMGMEKRFPNATRAQQAQDLFTVHNDKAVNGFDYEPKVSLERGIDLDDESLLRAIDQLRTIAPKLYPNKSVELIDDAYAVADFLARTFVVLSSSHMANNFRADHSKLDNETREINRGRRLLKKSLYLPATPIEIDVAQVETLLQTTDPKKIRLLLGWTSVRRSKPIFRMDGTQYRRKPHDRHIKAPVDRRYAEYNIQNSDPNMTFEIADNRPHLIRSNTPRKGHDPKG